MVIIGKEGSPKIQDAKGVAEILAVKVKALADFIKMIAAELFKQGVGDDRCYNGFGDHTCSRNCAGVAAFEAGKCRLQGFKVKGVQGSEQRRDRFHGCPEVDGLSA